MSNPYTPKMPVNWWLKKRVYFFYVMRELTSVFVAAYCVILVLGLKRLLAGPEAWDGFVALMQSPGFVVFHVLALVMACYHSITWLNLTPKVIVVQLGEERLPPIFVAGGHYAAWIVVSAVLIWLCVSGF